MVETDYKMKYLKYKQKYLNLVKQLDGGNKNDRYPVEFTIIISSTNSLNELKITRVKMNSNNRYTLGFLLSDSAIIYNNLQDLYNNNDPLKIPTYLQNILYQMNKINKTSYESIKIKNDKNDTVYNYPKESNNLNNSY